MQYIPTNLKINLEWSVKKGVGNEAEDFSRSTVSLFLFSDENRWAIPCEADYAGVVRAEIPETMPEGVYGLELIWIKNGQRIDGLRSVQRTSKPHVFALDYNITPPTSGQPLTVKMSTVAAPYGYDGLNAYDLAVLHGAVAPGSISEREWADLAKQMVEYIGPGLIRKGSYATLPDPKKQIIPIGFTYLLQSDANDLSTLRPVWWNGVAWVDSFTDNAEKSEQADKELHAKIDNETLVRDSQNKILAESIGQNAESIQTESRIRQEEDNKLHGYVDENCSIIDAKKVEARDIDKSVNNIEENIVLHVKALQQRVESITPIIMEGGTITNNADEEDLTEAGNVLKFKDRDTLYGMGFVIVRRDKAPMLQFTTTNTIYSIRYDIDLKSGTLEVPDDSVLLFEGGRIKNGTVILNDTLVLPNGCDIEQYIQGNVVGTFAKGQQLFDPATNTPKYYDGANWVDATGAELGMKKVGIASDKPMPEEHDIPVGYVFLQERASGGYEPYVWTGTEWVEMAEPKNLIPNSGSVSALPSYNDLDIPDGFQYLAYKPDGTVKPMWFSKTKREWIEGTVESKLNSVGFASDRPDPTQHHIPVGFLFLEKQTDIGRVSGEPYFNGEYKPYLWTGTEWTDTENYSHLKRIGTVLDCPDARFQQIPIGFMFFEEQISGEYTLKWFTGTEWVDAQGKSKPLPTSGEWHERPQNNVPDGYQYLLKLPDAGSVIGRTFPIWWSANDSCWIDAQGSAINGV